MSTQQASTRFTTLPDEETLARTVDALELHGSSSSMLTRGTRLSRACH